MKIACISMVRDECDIIELFVRINCRVFDHMFIIDNNSADATPFILEQLKKEGLPITTTFDGDNTYNQDGVTNKAVQHVNSLGIYDWVLLLDADEFIYDPKEDVLDRLNAVPRHLTPKLMWRSWVPTSSDYFQYKAPLYNCFAPLKTENHITYKAAIDRVRIPHVKINHGNHQWLRKDSDVKFLSDMDCGIRINHFPVRSVEQITSKAVLSNYRQLIRSAARSGPHMGPHRTFFQLSAIHTELRKCNYQVTPDMLRHFGVMYNVEIPPSGNDPQIDSAMDGVKFGFEEDEIQHIQLSKIALGSRFDKQMEIMHGVIKKMQRKLQEFGVMS